ncbi:MAG: acyl-CoA thioesterase [Rhodobacteraceae bacterium]|nr:acyl-CoA thioesterase [Paracoccaceae bacterium]
MTERLELVRGVVHPWHHDHFGHMNVRHYAPFFDDASYHMWTRLGLAYRDLLAQYGLHAVSAEARTRFVQELQAGDLIMIDGVVSRIGTKSCAFHLRMIHADTGALHATYDLVEVFFDPKTRRSATMPDTVRDRLQRYLVAE